MVRYVCAIAIIAASPRATAEDRTWIYGGLCLGGGSGRFGEINGAAFVDGHRWITPRTGVFATVVGYAASENEAAGRHSKGSLFGGGISVRHAWTQHGRGGWTIPMRAFASLGLGLGHHSGTEWVDDRSNTMTGFDARAVAWTARAGIAYLLGPVVVGTQAVAYGFGRGGALDPFSIVIGAAF
jgi:hypothetical protein